MQNKNIRESKKVYSQIHSLQTFIHSQHIHYKTNNLQKIIQKNNLKLERS